MRNTAPAPSPQAPLGRGKLIAFSLVTTALALILFNLGIEALESKDLLTTLRVDDRAAFLGDDAQPPDAEGLADAPPRWRMTFHGASFVLGTPYRVHPDEKRPGGMSSFVAADLSQRFPSQSPQVRNFGMGGINSGLVGDLFSRSLGDPPDLLFVATCNNEGSLDPSQVSKALNRLGGYRLLKRLLKPEIAPEARPLHTVQSIQPEAIRIQLEANLRRMAREARAAGVPLLMATLPVNLRYTGWQIGHPLMDARTDAQRAPWEPSSCILRAKEIAESGDVEGALVHLSSCQGDPADALRWRGLFLLKLDRVQEAEEALSLSVEVTPRNRCRPSLNALIREIAPEEEGVYLVDLESRARTLSPDGLPGRDLFLDYCHMHWRGYYEMAQEILRVMERHGLMPSATPEASPPHSGGPATGPGPDGHQRGGGL